METITTRRWRTSDRTPGSGPFSAVESTGGSRGRWSRAPDAWTVPSTVASSPPGVHLWSQALVETAAVPGAVLEIGGASGGTAAHCDQLLRNIGAGKPYVALDTFDGFVAEQFDHDVALGTPESVRHGFAASSLPLVRQIVRRLGAPDVQLIRGDIVTIKPDALPRRISAVLVDVDLSLPVHAALRKVWPLLSPGGVVLVDDCDPENGFRARDGYRRFCQEHELPERYEHGMGVLRRAASPVTGDGGGAVPAAL